MRNENALAKRDNAMNKQESNVPLGPERIRGGRTYVPSVDIIEAPDKFVLRAEMPGVASEGADVTYENGELRILGRVQPPDEDRHWLYREYGVGDYYRAFQLGEGIDGQRINATISNGMLVVDLPKRPEVAPRKISVKAR